MSLLTCSKCHREHNRNGRYCHECHRAYMKEWRKTHRLQGESRRRHTARAYAREYVKRGYVPRSGCCVCGDVNSEMHHPDYHRPLYVYWLCRKHHVLWHDYEKAGGKLAFEQWIPADAQPAISGPPKRVSYETEPQKTDLLVEHVTALARELAEAR